jgi:hypothetical protein
MKSLMVSVAIGACMLLSASTLVAAGQPNQSCQDLIAANAGSTPGNAGSTSNKGSPFAGGTSDSNYAGAKGVNTRTTPSITVNSQYDVACSKQVP